MRYLISILLLIGLVNTVQAKTLLVLGDSLSAAYGISPSEGWVSLMADRLSQVSSDYQVVNASVSGETTSGGLNRLPSLLATHKPQWVLIELGANDALRGTPISVIRENLSALIELSLAEDAQVLLVGIRIPSNYGARYGDAFFELFTEVADHYEVDRVPFLLENVALNWDLMQSDGLHPNAQAQPVILDNVWPFVERLLED